MIPSLDPFPLRGVCIGISISAGDQGVSPGQDPHQFANQLTFQTCSRFLYLGASVALGHKWAPGGIMRHVVQRAMEFRYSFGSSELEGRLPPIINLLAWPDKSPSFDDDEGASVREILEIRQIVPPKIPLEELDASSRLGRFARIRALTAMRQALVAASDYRICLGGERPKPLRRLPGIVEESLLTYEAGKPLYLSGAFGGMTKTLCDVILHRSASDHSMADFETPEEALSLFQEFQGLYQVPVMEGPSLPSTPFDAFALAQGITVERLASQAFLSVDDYLTLMNTPDVARALQLAGMGIANHRQSTRPVPT